MHNFTTKIKFFILSFFIFLSLPYQINAQELVFSDDFSQGFDKWQSVRKHNYWQIIDSQAHAIVPNMLTLTELVPKDDYWNSDWKNISYEMDYRYTSGADKNISFNFIDISNWYEIHFVNGIYEMVHLKKDDVVWSHRGDLAMQLNQTYHFKFELRGGHIILFVDGEKVIDVLDPTFDNDYGKIGIKAGTGASFPTHIVYDNIIVKNLDEADTKITINHLKQSDPKWATEEYDSAKIWSKDGDDIDRWGCLITSISMIMNYHGINQIPNSQPVDPKSINNWLKEQSDGYLNGGLVNWLAITRLTKKISDSIGSVKLEYQRLPAQNNLSNDIKPAIEKIKLNQPPILEIDGHFLVANGFDNKEEDLFILDPSFDYQKLSQHNKALLSTRFLTPSHTDLSYIQIISEKEINFKIFDQDNSEIDIEKYTEQIKTPDQKSTTKKLYFYNISKPKTQKYKLEIYESSTFDLYLYDVNAEVKNEFVDIKTYKEKVAIELNYNKNNIEESSIIYNKKIDHLEKIIHHLYIEKEIYYTHVYLQLKNIVNFFQKKQSLTEENKKFFLDNVDWYKDKMTHDAKEILTQNFIIK